MKSMMHLVLVAMMALVGCGEDISQQQNEWTTQLAEAQARVANLRQQYTALQSAAQSLPDFGGVASLAQARTTLTEKLNSCNTAIASIDGVITAQTEAVIQSFTQKKIAAATEAIGAAMSTINQSVTTAAQGVGEAQSSIGQLQAAAPLFTQMTQFRTQFTQSQAQTTATATGMIDFLDIDFKSGTAEFELSHPNTQPALDRMVAIMKSCPGIQAEILGHTSREGSAELNQTLSTQRAEAIRTYLTGHGVNRRAITSATGKADTMLAVPEPAPNSPDATAMNPELLEALRVVNRRVSLNVTTACAAAN